MGTFHHVSPKHLNRYIGEFSGRHNDRPSDTIEQMTHLVQGMGGNRLRHTDLIAGGPAYPLEIEFGNKQIRGLPLTLSQNVILKYGKGLEN